jgi:hypothetical protein
MKQNILRNFLLGIALAFACCLSVQAQVAVPGTFKTITIDGSFGDWAGVPLAYTAADGVTNAIQYENIYIANDQTNLYVRFTLYAPRPDALANSYDNIFIDTDNNPATGFTEDGIGSELLIQDGTGYQEAPAQFTDGTGVNNLGWNLAGSADSLDFEFSISLDATYSDSTQVFTNNTIAFMLEGDETTTYISSEFVPTSGGFVYTFATPPTPPTSDLYLVALTNSSWQVNASGTDLGTNWLAQGFDDTTNGWISGDGLFGYTTSPASYPPINTALSNGPTTYYFITQFDWTNDAENVALVVTNYLSDGAVYYLNGNEVGLVRMPAGAVSYATLATGTNPVVGSLDIFGLDGGDLQYGSNTLEVEVHQATNSTADLVFGLSLTASIDYPVVIIDPTLPWDESVLAGQPATFTSDLLGSGPLAYQWYFNGTNAIAGANAATYTIPLVLTNNAGTYSLSASNQFTNVTTRAALLTVNSTPVVITAQPVDLVAVEGQPVTFSVTVSGTPAIDYQWFFGANPIPGATNASYTVAYPLPTNAGGYYVVASNPASSTNSAVANLTVLSDTIPASLVSISAGPNQIIVTFSKPVDPVTSSEAGNYSVSGGVTVLTATQNPANSAQVVLTTGVAMNYGTVYSLAVNGVNDLFGNSANVTGQFARDITIDGSFDDWTGIAPIYTNSPTGNTDAADYAAIYVYNDANYYYFRVTLWTDINPTDGQFPDFAELYFDTDNNINDGYEPGTIGSELMIQSGYAYDERGGTFGGPGIDGLNFLCLPAVPGTNFEFQLSRSAVFDSDQTPVFTTNLINFVFQGWTPNYNPENQAPPGGLITYSNVTPPTVAPLPLGGVGISSLSGGQAALIWNSPGTVQSATNLAGPWTNVSAATSPYVIPTDAAGTGEFYRLTQ